MDETQRRAMRDRHSLDEARLRQSEQRSAGAAPMPHADLAHGAESPLPRSADSEDALVREYEATLQAERAAWAQVQDLPGGQDHMEPAWHAWRSAVEARDRATRHLINYSLGLPA